MVLYEHVRMVQEFSKSCKTVVRCAVGGTASRIHSEAPLVRYGDGQTDR